MTYDVSHITEYRYSEPASEAYIETRLTPPAMPHQEILAHELSFEPPSGTSEYVDYFGNRVTFYSKTLRHERLKIINRLKVKTHPRELPTEALETSLAETRQIFSGHLTGIYDYLQPIPAIPTGGEASRWARKYFSDRASLGNGLTALNSAIHSDFKYVPGSTDNATPLPQVWKQRKGVCQDFAQIMLSILRTAGLPARYVCGYIEGVPATADSSVALVGSLATHAWVEVMVPGHIWVALDPTNNCWCNEQHITVAVGRHFREATPVRGTFKAAGRQRMRVSVRVRRLRK